MKSECCEEFEQRWGYANMEVGWLWQPCKWVRGFCIRCVRLFWSSEESADPLGNWEEITHKWGVLVITQLSLWKVLSHPHVHFESLKQNAGRDMPIHKIDCCHTYRRRCCSCRCTSDKVHRSACVQLRVSCFRFLSDFNIQSIQLARVGLTNDCVRQRLWSIWHSGAIYKLDYYYIIII